MIFLRGLCFKGKPKELYDGNDRLHFCVTSLMLILFAAFIFILQLTKQPITCTPVKNLSSEFVEKYCYNHDIYYINSNETDSESQRPSHLGHYQWIPLILLIQAFLFYLPHFIWQRITHSYYLNIRQTDEKKDWAMTIYDILDLINSRLDATEKKAKIWLSKEKLTWLYMVIKLLYFLNLGLQLLWIKNLAIFYPQSGIYDLFEGFHSSFSEILCDIKLLNVSSTIEDITVQCELSTTMYYEKLFLILAIWYTFLAVASIFNIVSWIHALTSPFSFFINHIKSKEAGDIHVREELALKRFQYFLTSDGLLLLHFIKIQCGTIAARDVTTELFTQIS